MTRFHRVHTKPRALFPSRVVFLPTDKYTVVVIPERKEINFDSTEGGESWSYNLSEYAGTVSEEECIDLLSEIGKQTSEGKQ